MDSKKSPKADLERKSSMFFLVGLALSMLLVLVVFQYKKVKTEIIPKEFVGVIDPGPDIPITVTPVKEKAEVVKPRPDPNPELPPEVDPKVKLEINELFKEPIEGADEGLEEIGIEDFGKRDVVETVDFILIEKMARPFECEEYNNIDEQKKCLNSWIQNYLGKNVKYPEKALKLNLEDKVYVTFIISEKGEVESAVVELGKYEMLNEGALRVVKAMPEFIPGSQHRKPVKMKMTIPINFTLSSF